MHNRTTWNEKLFAGKLNHWYNWYLSRDGIGLYAINCLLFLATTKSMLKCMKDLSCKCECMPRQ